MMSETFNQQRLQATSMFRIVEMVKWIKWLWVLLAAGIILALMTDLTMALPEGAVARLGKGGITANIAFSPDGKMLAVVTYTGVYLYDPINLAEVGFLRADELVTIAFSPDGGLLGSGSGDGTVKLWDVKAGQEVVTLKGHSSAVYSVAFSPDGNLLASGSYDKTAD